MPTGRPYADAMKPELDFTSDVGFLALIFKVGRGAAGQDEHANLARFLETRINCSESLIRPTHLGFDSATHLATEFAKEMTALRLRPPTFEDFAAANRARGYQSRILGKLCHLFVRNFQPVQEDFLASAVNQLKSSIARKSLNRSFLLIRLR